MMDFGRQVKYSYLITVVGVALLAITVAFGAVRPMLIRATFRGGLGGTRQFGNANPFALTSSLAILAAIMTIAGLAWLGLALRKSHKSPTE